MSVLIPDDTIAHHCNKLIVTLRSLQPDTYRIAPDIRGQGFEDVTDIDNDGGNLDASPVDEDRVSDSQNKFVKSCH
ncbi:MAG: hypothetical protein OXC53_12345 [Rhodobacteraceae bacterium]|nr:hypothetical protein [Paracoccaceae bacterium]